MSKVTKNAGTKIVLIVILAIILILIITMFAVATWGYNQNFGRRVEYTPEDGETTFEQLSGIERESVTFETSKKVNLSGYIYTKTGGEKPKATIVFVHGFGGTHQWELYLKEFEYLINRGYSVFSYDNTGCGISDGKNMIGLSQSLIDLDHALTFLEEKQDLPVMLYGHSWGGFTVSAGLNTDHNITAVVERSGFNSGKEIVFDRGKDMVGNLMYAVSPFTGIIEFVKFGKYARYTAVDGINRVEIPVLIMHSKDDLAVPYDLSIANMASSITNSKAKIHVFEKKGHDVSISLEAYKNGEKRLDEVVMNEIGDFFDAAL